MQFLTSLTILAISVTSLAAESPLSRIGFGSCANEKRPQPIWEAIDHLNPQLFILTGDNVYADSGDPAVLKASYEKFAAEPGFAKLREKCPVIGTWDDHDYGLNDGGEEWAGKEAAKAAFLEFFATPEESPLRTRSGVYDAQLFGPEDQRIQILLLDTRSFRGPLLRMNKAETKKLRAKNGAWNGPYLPAENSKSSILGEEQWEWLEEQLQVPAALRLIVSSIQVLAIDHGWEKWGNLPRQRQRLIDLVRGNPAPVIFLSGDRHTADISILPPSGNNPHPLYDITSSGLNQSGSSQEDNRYRVGHQPPFGPANFGWLSLDWTQNIPTVKMEIRDIDGKVVREAATTLSPSS